MIRNSMEGNNKNMKNKDHGNKRKTRKDLEAGNQANEGGEEKNVVEERSENYQS